MKRPVPRILFVFLCALALMASICFAPVVHALPPAGRAVHRHPSPAAGGWISFDLYNSAMSSRDFEMGGKVYRMAGHQGLRLQAAAGTAVLAGGAEPGVRRGEVLFVVRPILQDKTRLLY